MPNYTKLFNSIVTSTIWTEDDQTRIVWITMLAMADQHGEVHASIPGLARVAGVPVDAARSAIGKFLSPDPDSRTPDNEGRRISPIDGGWELLNHKKYRAMASKEDAKIANAERQKRHRQRNAKVTQRNGLLTPERDIADTEAEIQKETDAPVTIEKAIAYGSQIGASEQVVRNWFTIRERDEWMIHGSNGFPRPVRNWMADLATAKSWKVQDSGKSPNAKKPDGTHSSQVGLS